jgi:hypothetical protein
MRFVPGKEANNGTSEIQASQASPTGGMDAARSSPLTTAQPITARTRMINLTRNRSSGILIHK